jgi:hypothetical protein
LIYKGGILHGWGKKMVVGVHSAFFAQLPTLQETTLQDAEIAWLIYDLQREPADGRYKLVLTKTVYTRFKEAMDKITVTEAGKVEDFLYNLQARITKGKIIGQPMQSGLPPEVEPLTTFESESSDVLGNGDEE